MQRQERHPPNWSLEPPSGSSPLQGTSQNQVSIYQRSRTTSSASKTTYRSPGTVMLRPRRNRPHMRTRNDGRSQITRLGTKFIWRPRTCGYGSRRRAEVRNFIHVTLVRFQFLKRSLPPRITHSNYHQSSTSTPKLKVHARRLKLAHDNDLELFPGRIPPNPPRIDADDEQYAVEAILDHRQVGRSRQFLVHWEGYSETEDSWVKEGDIDAEMVHAYLEALEKEGENEAHKVGKRTTTPSPKRTGGRSARSRRVKKH